MQKRLLYVIAGALGIYLFFLLLRPLSDPDLFWHLKTGEYILKERALPGPQDPFCYTSPNPLSKAETNGLRSQWLGQVVFYISYLLGGYLGVMLLRAALILTPFIWIFIRAEDKLTSLLAGVFPVLLISASLGYSYERPQAFSYLLALPLYLALKSNRLYILPALMLLWANLHGGYIVGVGIIGLSVFGEILNQVARKMAIPWVGEQRKDLFKFVLIALFSVLITGLRPGGYSMLWGLVQLPLGLMKEPSGIVAREVLEYKSLWFFYKVYALKWPVFIGLFIGIGGLSFILKIIKKREIDFIEALVFISISAFGIIFAKGIGFALIFSALMISDSRIRGKERFIIPTISLILTLSLVSYISGTEHERLRPKIPKDRVNLSLYPEDSVRFIEREGIQGPMYNDMRWGGYLMWRLGHKYKVFYDTRETNSEVLATYLAISRGSSLWKTLLDSYGINFIITPLVSPESGTAYGPPLRMAEEMPDDWRLVFISTNEAVFVRNNPINRPIIEKNPIPYKNIYLKLLELSETLSTRPDSAITRAIALYGLGMKAQAIDALSYAPDTEFTRALRERMLQGGRLLDIIFPK